MSRSSLALALSIVMVCGILTPTTASAQTNTTVAASASSRNAHDGEALYRGLFFGEGPVATLFPELTTDVVVSQQMAAARSRLVSRIGTDDPAFFTRFAKLINSGNPLRVRQGLLDAQQHTRDAMTDEFGSDLTADGSIGTECITIEFVVIAVFFATVAVLVLFVNAAEYINLALEGNVAYTVNVTISATPMGPAPSTATSLALDRWSTRIASVLAGS